LTFLTQKDFLSETFATICRQRPAEIALFAPDQALCFRDLYQQSQLLASALAAYQAQAIGLFFAPESAYYLALLACMQAGAVAVPLDSARPLPAARARAHGLSLCLSTRAGLQALKAWADCPVIVIEELLKTPSALTPAKAQSALPELLHRIVTSGSSGQGTEVSIGRQAVSVHIQEVGPAYGIQPGSAHANLSRHSSAAGINGFWRVLLNGGCFVSADLYHEDLRNVWQRLQGIPQLQSLHGQPSVLTQLAQTCGQLPAPSGLQHLIIGGEPLSKPQLAQLAVLLPPDGRVSYNYSSSETLHIAMHTARLQDLLALERPIPCGRPFPSREVLIVNAEGQLLPPGKSGQIIVRSAHLALQLKGPAASQRLQADPDKPGFFRYLTGDLGRWNAQGQLEHLGRCDRQLKVRGQWVDLNEVERALLSLPEVSQACVLQLNLPTGSELIACLVRPLSLVNSVKPGEPDPRSTVQALSELLKPHLAPAALPGHFMDLAALPLLLTGKVDQQALRQMAENWLREQRAEAVSARDQPSEHETIYQELRALWLEVLETPLLSDSCSFSAAGGNSLKAAVLISHLNARYQLKLPPWWALQHASLQAQSEALARLQPTAAPPQRSRYASASPAAIRQALGWQL